MRIPSGIEIKYKENPQGYLRAYYVKNRQKLLEAGRERGARWRDENRQHKRDHSRTVNAQRKLEAFELFGGTCAECGFSDIRALQIDHVNGCHLPRHERIKKGESGLKLYMRLLKGSVDKTKYQLLCANCNWIKRVESGECRRAS